MLVLSRKVKESVLIEGGIRVMVVGVKGDKVRLGFVAPDGRWVMREELVDRDGGGTRPKPPEAA